MQRRFFALALGGLLLLAVLLSGMSMLRLTASTPQRVPTTPSDATAMGKTLWPLAVALMAPR